MAFEIQFSRYPCRCSSRCEATPNAPSKLVARPTIVSHLGAKFFFSANNIIALSINILQQGFMYSTNY